MPINTKHSQYLEYAKKWEKCQDCISGEDTIKAKGQLYLPMPTGWESDRYDRYKFRATFVEFCGRVLSVSIGQLFRKKPVTSGISDEIMNNIDLRGTSFDYFWRQVASEVISKNRVGIFVDYSNERKRPYLVMYKAESIINWQTESVNGEEKLSLVVLEGKANKEIQEDRYNPQQETRWKVLELSDGKFVSTDYKLSNENVMGDEFVSIEESRIIEKNSIGDSRNYLDFIPFFMVTSNGISIDLLKPPILGVVNLNLGHYRGYADYETMLYLTSQKTVITKAGKDEPFPIGGVVNFKDPAGGASFLEASPNSGTKDELRHKEEMMASLSSSFLSGSGRYVASAETAEKTSQGEYATLADISNALTISATRIMEFTEEWLQNKAVDVSVSFNTDFEMKDIDPGYLTALMGALGSGYISFETFYYNLRNKEVYPPNSTIEDELKKIDEYSKKKIEIREESIGRRFDLQPGTEDNI